MASNKEKAVNAQQVTVSISHTSILRVLSAIFGIWALIQLQSVVAYLLFSMLFAVALQPLITKVQDAGLKRGAALGLVLMLIVGGAIGLIVVALISISNTLFDFLQLAPAYLEDYQVDGLVGEVIVGIQDGLSGLDASKIASDAFKGGGSLLSGLSAVAEATLFIFFFTVYMLLEKDYLLNIAHSLIPEEHRDEARDVAQEGVRVIGGYIRGQAITSALVGVVTFVSLTILGIPNAFALAIIAAFADIIPIVGSIIGLVPVILVALTVSPFHAFLAAILTQGYAIINSNLIVPKVYGKSLDLSPFIVTLASTVGLILFGAAGILMALPVTAIIAYVLTKYKGLPLIVDRHKASK